MEIDFAVSNLSNTLGYYPKSQATSIKHWIQWLCISEIYRCPSQILCLSMLVAWQMQLSKPWWFVVLLGFGHRKFVFLNAYLKCNFSISSRFVSQHLNFSLQFLSQFFLAYFKPIAVHGSLISDFPCLLWIHLGKSCPYTFIFKFFI